MSHPVTPEQQQQQQQVANPEPEALRNLMVNYIPTTVDEMQLRQLFERFGPIESVKIVCDRLTRQSRGYGFIKYQNASSAQQAINELNGFNILNKRLKVALAAAGNQRPRQQYGQQPMYPGGMQYGYQQTPYMANPQQQQQQQPVMQAPYLGQYMQVPQANAGQSQ